MSTLSSSKAAQASDVYPLNELYLRAGEQLPSIEVISADEVPQPYRRLLVHNSDMTSTLEKFYGDRIHLEVLRRQEAGHDYFREVILALDRSRKPVEFGAIRIDLALFEPKTRDLIIEARLPLGRILAEGDVTYTSRPRAFLRIASDAFIGSVLRISGKPELYGRRNTLFDPQHRALADIVEILPPAEEANVRPAP